MIFFWKVLYLENKVYIFGYFNERLLFFNVSFLILLKLFFLLNFLNCEYKIWVWFFVVKFFKRFINLILFVFGIIDLMKLWICFIFLFSVMIINVVFLEFDMFLYNFFILFFSWFFLMFVIFLMIVLLKIMGWLLIENFKGFWMIIGDVLVIDLYIW